MTHYDQLKSAFAQQVADNKIFVEQNIAFAKNIAGDIRAFLDLPEDPPKSDTSKPYMQFLRLDPEKGFEPKDTIAQAVINMPEGKFQFGLGVLLETGIDNFRCSRLCHHTCGSMGKKPRHERKSNQQARGQGSLRTV